MNDTDFLAKPWFCNTLESLRRLVVVWEQFHDCHLLLTARRYSPWEGFWDKSISWVFLSEKFTLTGIGCFSEVFWEENLFLDIVSQKQLSCDFCTSSACCEVKETFGRFQLEAPWAYKCKQILGLLQCWKEFWNSHQRNWCRKGFGWSHLCCN